MPYKVQIDDVVREATKDEEAVIEAARVDAERHQAEQAARDEARQSAIGKLSALGLTDAEIAAMIGG